MRSILMSAAILLASTTSAFAGDGQVSTSGTGIVKVTPDQASVTLVVTTDHEQAAKAHHANIAATNSLFKLLADQGFDKNKDFQTSHFFVGRKYDEQGKPSGYRSSHSIIVNCKQLSKIEKLLDAIAKDGDSVVQIGNVSFDSSKRDVLSDQARDLAIADAKRKAGQLATGAGATLGNVVSISESSSDNRFYADRSFMNESAAPGRMQIAPGEKLITVTVQTTWQLTPAK